MPLGTWKPTLRRSGIIIKVTRPTGVGLLYYIVYGYSTTYATYNTMLTFRFFMADSITLNLNGLCYLYNVIHTETIRNIL